MKGDEMALSPETKARREEIAQNRAHEKNTRVDLTEWEINYLIDSCGRRRPWENRVAVLIKNLEEARGRCD